MKNKNYLLLSSSLFLLFLFWNNPVLAAQPLKAEVVSQSQTVLRLRPGQSFTVSVKKKIPEQARGKKPALHLPH